MKPLKWESEVVWEKINKNYASYFEGKYFLVELDSYTK